MLTQRAAAGSATVIYPPCPALRGLPEGATIALDLGTLTGYLELDDSDYSTKTDAAPGNMSAAMAGVAAAAAAGVALAVGELYKIGATFDDVSDTIRASTGASGDVLDGLVQNAKNVGERLPESFDQIGPAIAQVNQRLGLTGDTLETVASQYLEAGRVLGQDADINASTAALTAFGIQGDDVSGALDTMFQVAQRTGVSMNDLAAGIQTQAPALQELGFSYADSVNLLGTLDKAGVDADSAMGSLTRGMVNLAKAGEDPEQAFQRVTGQISDFITQGNTAGALDLASQVFGTRGAPRFISALQSGALNMSDLMGATAETGDTILGVGQDTMDFAERWSILMNQAMVAIAPLANQVFSAVGDGLAAVMPWLTSLADWLTANPVMEIIAAAVGVLAVGFIGLTVAAWAMNSAIWATTAALLANPITWIILGIVALIAAIVLLVANWDAVTQWLGDVWNGFITWFQGVMDGFLAWWGGVWDGFLGFLNDAWTNITNAVSAALDFVVQLFLNWTLLGLLIQYWGAIVDGATAAWNGLMGFLGAIPGWIVGVFVGVGSWLLGIGTDLLTGLWNGITGFWGTIFAWFQGLPGTIAGFFSGIGDWLWQAGSDLIQDLLDGISSLAGTIGTFFLNLLPDWIVGPFKAALGIASPSKVFMGFGENIVEGLMGGLDTGQSDLDARMSGLVGPQDYSVGAQLATAVLGPQGFGQNSDQSPTTVDLSGARIALRVGDREFDAYVEEFVTQAGEDRRRQLVVGQGQVYFH